VLAAGRLIAAGQIHATLALDTIARVFDIDVERLTARDGSSSFVFRQDRSRNASHHAG
jgi:ABC-type cobalamin/Fe3+-siderophores transport system ATPase subunit